MGKDVSELASYVIPVYLKFYNAAHGAGINILLVDTGRNEAQQKVNLAHHVSWTKDSRHLPQEPEGKSEAFDVCPTEYLGMKGWNPEGPLWAQLGVIGEKLGLEWGGRWLDHPDPGHFQWPRESMQIHTDPELST